MDAQEDQVESNGDEQLELQHPSASEPQEDQVEPGQDCMENLEQQKPADPQENQQDPIPDSNKNLEQLISDPPENPQESLTEVEENLEQKQQLSDPQEAVMEIPDSAEKDIQRQSPDSQERQDHEQLDLENMEQNGSRDLSQVCKNDKSVEKEAEPQQKETSDRKNSKEGSGSTNGANKGKKPFRFLICGGNKKSTVG